MELNYELFNGLCVRLFQHVPGIKNAASECEVPIKVLVLLIPNTILFKQKSDS